MLDQIVTRFADQDRELVALACPSEDDTRFFEYCMKVALARGMTKDKALEYVIRCRNTTVSHW